MGREAWIKNPGVSARARLAAVLSGISIRFLKPGFFSVRVVRADGACVFHEDGTGFVEYRVVPLQRGSYLVQVEANGQSMRKRISIP